MSEATFDIEVAFDQDYLYFYEPLLTPERSEREVEVIWRLLALKAGGSVLDLACGHGRIANRLAERGCHVTGLDATALFLKLARQDAQALGVLVEYIKGDMRSLPWTERFDCIVNWFTAYGYFHDEDNRKVLREAYRTLKPGGKLLIDIINREFMVKNFCPDSVSERDGNYLIDRNQYDVLTGQTHTERIIIRNGQTRRFHYSIRHFTYPEFRDWLIAAGFNKVEVYGREGEAFTLDSRRMLIVAHK